MDKIISHWLKIDGEDFLKTDVNMKNIQGLRKKLQLFSVTTLPLYIYFFSFQFYFSSSSIYVLNFLQAVAYYHNYNKNMWNAALFYSFLVLLFFRLCFGKTPRMVIIFWLFFTLSVCLLYRVCQGWQTLCCNLLDWKKTFLQYKFSSKITSP